jgi:hypothetical protein
MIWDSDQYWKKAIRYVEMASQTEREPWERPFWLSLALEFLARSALTKIHPALNADPEGEGLNLMYAFGFDLKGQPKSLPIHAVLLRLQKVFPEAFNKPRREFCDFFSNIRNQELHTCDLPFESLSETTWLARFYDVCQALCTILEKSLADLFGDDEAKTGEELVKALKTEKLSAVKSKIAAHKKVFDDKPLSERTQIRVQQETLASSWYGTQTKVACPACECLARLQGTLERVSEPFYDGKQLLVKNVLLANRLECKACGLVLADIDELHIAEVEPHFEYYEATELHQYHEEDYGQEYDNM